MPIYTSTQLCLSEMKVKETHKINTQDYKHKSKKNIEKLQRAIET